jgi:hypothetical protein
MNITSNLERDKYEVKESMKVSGFQHLFLAAYMSITWWFNPDLLRRHQSTPGRGVRLGSPVRAVPS